MSVSGSIQDISINGREFAVAADADANMKLGGFENEYQANGNGTARQVKTRTPWSLTGVAVSIDADQGDLEFLQEIADGNDNVPIAITYASGAVYQGEGSITGEVQESSQNGTATIELGGPGKLTKQ